MPRVKSKNLFNFTLTGEYDADVAEKANEMAEKFMKGEEGMKFIAEMANVMDKHDAESNKKYMCMMRSMVDDFMKPMLDQPILKEASENVDETEIKVPTNHDGNFDF